MSRTVLLSALIAFTGFIMGCSPTDIVVTDASGMPIEGAVVTGTSLSVSGQTTRTDKNGAAKIPQSVQESRWISVAKPGYTSSGNIDVNQMKPIKLILKKK